MKKQLLRYWLAMNASAFDSAVHSVVVFFGMAGAHQMTDAIPALSLPQLAGAFLAFFGRAILSYLDDHPLETLTWSDSVKAAPVEPGKPSVPKITTN